MNSTRTAREEGRGGAGSEAQASAAGQTFFFISLVRGTPNEISTLPWELDLVPSKSDASRDQPNDHFSRIGIIKSE